MKWHYTISIYEESSERYRVNVIIHYILLILWSCPPQTLNFLRDETISSLFLVPSASTSLEAYAYFIGLTSRCSFLQIGDLGQDCPIFNLVTIHKLLVYP